MEGQAMIIAVDFDGTCTTHEYPRVGKEIGAPRILRAVRDAGHRFILWTMRTNSELDDAIAWFADNDLPLWGINSNPEQAEWTSSPKAYAHAYIDDAAIGCPLKFDKALSNRPFVDWERMGEELLRRKIISEIPPIDNTEPMKFTKESG